MEIIVLDSMSTDKSLEIALTFGAKIVTIDVETFDHGLTRNLGVEYASGELIYFTVQDAWLPDQEMLEKMVRHFEIDAATMAVCGHQAVPHEKDKNPMLWYRPVSKAGFAVKKVKSQLWFEQLAQSEKKAVVAWDNVVAMYRRKALVELPFVKAAYAEDWIWSYHAQLKGWQLLHDSSLVVYHYHHLSYSYAFKTKFTINYHFGKFLGFKAELPELLIPLMRTIYHLGRNRKLTLKEKLYWIVYNTAITVADFHSVCNFKLRAYMGGQVSLEKGYSRYCKTIPQGVQKQSLTND